MKKRLLYITLVIAPFVAQAQAPLSLSEALRMGLENNYGIQIRKKGAEAASVRNSWAMAGGVPTVGLRGSALGDFENDPTLNASVTAEVNWTVFDGFRIQATKAQLAAAEDMARGNEMLTVENTIQSIINSYCYVRLQQEMLHVNETLLSISKDRLEQQEVARSIGVSGTYEYVQAKTDYLSDKSTYLNQEKALRESMRQLNLLLSLTPDTLWTLDQGIEIPQGNYDLEQMKAAMLQDNRTLRNQYINLRTKELEIKQQRAAWYPSIGLNASLTAGLDRGALDRDYLRPQLGVTLNYSLFNGQRRRNVSIAKINLEAEKISTQQMELSLVGELTMEFDNYNTSAALVANENEQLAMAKTLMQLSEERYRNGTISSFDFRRVQLSYLSAAISRLNTIYAQVVSHTELLRLTGGILSYGE